MEWIVGRLLSYAEYVLLACIKMLFRRWVLRSIVQRIAREQLVTVESAFRDQRWLRRPPVGDALDILPVNPLEFIKFHRSSSPQEAEAFVQSLYKCYGAKNRILLLGEAGAGKTTLLRFISQLIASDNSNVSDAKCKSIKLIPLLLDADANLTTQVEGIISLHLERISEKFMFAKALTSESVLNYLSSKRAWFHRKTKGDDIHWLIIVDGLNEIGRGEELIWQQICKIAHRSGIPAAERFLNSSHILVTSRYREYLRNADSEGWEVWRMLDLDETSIKYFANNYVTPSEAEQFENLLISHQLIPLARVPLFLSLMVALYKRNVSSSESYPLLVFSSRGSIIRKIVDFAFDWHNRSRSLNHALAQSDDEATLRRFAYHLVELGIGTRIHASAIPSETGSKDTYDRLIDTGILESSWQGFTDRLGLHVGFWHETLRDFFAGQELIFKHQNGNPLPLSSLGLWAEPLAIALGSTPQTTIQAVVETLIALPLDVAGRVLVLGKVIAYNWRLLTVDPRSAVSDFVLSNDDELFALGLIGLEGYLEALQRTCEGLDNHLRLGQVLRARGHALYHNWQFNESRQLLQKALNHLEKALQSHSPEEKQQVIAEKSFVFSHIGLCESRLGNAGEAEQAFSEAFRCCDQLFDNELGDNIQLWVTHRKSEVFNFYGDYRLGRLEWPNAYKAYYESLALKEQLRPFMQQHSSFYYVH